MNYFIAKIKCDGRYVTAEMSGFSAKSLRLMVDGQMVYMKKQLFDLWMIHPELEFHLQKVQMPSGKDIIVLN